VNNFFNKNIHNACVDIAAVVECNTDTNTVEETNACETPQTCPPQPRSTIKCHWGWKSPIYDDPELAKLMYIIKIITTIIILIVIVWMSRKRWYNERTGEIDTWSILGIAVLTVILTNLVFCFIF
jgi:hypothetical protein